MTCPSRVRPSPDASGCDGLPRLEPKAASEAIVGGLVAMLAGLAPRQFRPNLFQFRFSLCRSFQAMGLSEWDAYQQAREIEQQADDQLCLIWDEAWTELP